MQKKLFASLLVTVALICACALAASAVGTLADDGVYEISTAKELDTLAKEIADGKSGVRNQKYRLTADIDMSEITDMIPIGVDRYAFIGEFDGNGKTVSGIKMNAETSASPVRVGFGFFGKVSNATIKNLTLKGDIHLTATTARAYVGGVVGQVAGSSDKTTTIQNCINRINVVFTPGSASKFTATNVGTAGIVGHVGDTSGTTKYLGKLVVTDCINYGTITGSKGVGGIIGVSELNDADNALKISGCKNDASVTAEKCDTSGYADVGGIVGMGYCVSIVKCENTGAVAATAEKATKAIGGINGRIAKAASTVSSCYNGGTVTSLGYAISYSAASIDTYENNYFKTDCAGKVADKDIEIDLALDSTSAKIYKAGNATVRYITRLTVDDAAAVESYGIMIAQTAETVNAKYATLTDSFEGTETTYAVDLVGIPEAARDINIYAWAYVNLAGGVQIVLPVAPVTVNGIIG